MMLEIGIVAFIVFAVGYWAILWAMGRREDVLHGHFVELDAQPEPAPAARPMPPSKAAFRPAARQPKPPPTITAAPPANVDVLTTLLASIEQDLNDAAKP